jgi:hypothetical protein
MTACITVDLREAIRVLDTPLYRQLKHVIALAGRSVGPVSLSQLFG